MIKAAIIGLGKMGISHAAILGGLPEVELVAMCNTDMKITEWLILICPLLLFGSRQSNNQHIRLKIIYGLMYLPVVFIAEHWFIWWAVTLHFHIGEILCHILLHQSQCLLSRSHQEHFS